MRISFSYSDLALKLQNVAEKPCLGWSCITRPGVLMSPRWTQSQATVCAVTEHGSVNIDTDGCSVCAL